MGAVVLDNVLDAVGNVEEVAVCPLRSQGFGGETGIFNGRGSAPVTRHGQCAAECD